MTGKLAAVAEEFATVAAPPFEYQVLIPEIARRRLQHQVGETIRLFTIEYLEGNPAQGRLTPRLVGFVTEVEREFFRMFCEVDGVGARKALRAMQRPVKEIAVAIVEQDAKLLSTLPGIGTATADRIIAKLRRKMSRFALLVAPEEPQADVPVDVVDDTYQALLVLGHSEADARRLLDGALQKKKRYKDVESLLQSVYEYEKKQA